MDPSMEHDWAGMTIVGRNMEKAHLNYIQD